MEKEGEKNGGEGRRTGMKGFWGRKQRRNEEKSEERMKRKKKNESNEGRKIGRG